jgi:competence protein ComGC
MTKRQGRTSEKGERSRGGFSLVELLLTIAICTVLMGLILPAIQRVREVANKAACAANLRRLGQAAHHYHADRGKLPPGYLGPSLANNTNRPAFYYEGQWIGHFPLLLPFLEQEALFHQIKVSFSVNEVAEEKWFWAAPANGPGPPNETNYRVAMKQLSFFRCPTAPPFTVPVGNPAPGGGGTLLGLHVFNSSELGPFTASWKDEYGSASGFRPLARTNYMGVAGCGTGTHAEFNQFEGIYTNRMERSLGELAAADGASNTLLYGETCTNALANRRSVHDICWMAGGGLGTYHGLEQGRKARGTTFSSYHSAGVQFCFGDGSVRLVRFGATQWNTNPATPLTADWRLLQQLAGWRDGLGGDPSRLLE